MINKNLLFTTIILVTYTLHSTSSSFEECWHLMQIKYNKLYNTMTSDELHTMESQLCHPYWIEQKQTVRQLILGAPNERFLFVPAISGTMVRQHMEQPQHYEIDFLTKLISLNTQEKLKLFKETTVGNLPHSCIEFDCSVNTLGHLYYAANIIENLSNQLDPIITEFGGGYGNLARIFKSVMPACTMIVIDLPEFIALQYLFLKLTLPSSLEIIVHSTQPKYYKSGVIHLIPAYLLDNLSLKSDVFISTFGLSETTKKTQNIIIKKHFFDANLCYISGQTDGWNMFENNHTIYNGIKKHYTVIKEKPFHISQNLNSYEIIGIKN